MASAATTLRSRRQTSEVGAACLCTGLRVLHVLVAAPSLVFLAMLAVMLFRPPDLRFYSLDRVAFVLLTFVVLLRICVQRPPLHLTGRLTAPMLALTAMAAVRILSEPYDVQNWGVFATRWLVPFALFHMAPFVFHDERSTKRLETFLLAVLVYLSLISVLFLFDAKAWIFPRYILDEGLGIHSDRARGPFLQAVANGMTLNLLGLLALDSFRRKRLRGLPAFALMALVPLAILATKTRAVWLSCAGSILYLLLFAKSGRIRRACAGMLAVILLAGLTITLCPGAQCSLIDRLTERSPVEFRVAVYEAGWHMFLQKPLSGWGPSAMQSELDRHVLDFHQDAFYVHNTYLEVLLQHGLLGLALYLWILFGLFALGRPSPGSGVLRDADFHALWPVFLVVYLLNASFVGMNYQFVNGVLFTIAGILAAQRRSAILAEGTSARHASAS